jgi:CRISPR-associated endonuclease/helicase Cas3
MPVPLLVPILDALKVLAEHFGTTVLLTSATQPTFDSL